MSRWRALAAFPVLVASAFTANAVARPTPPVATADAPAHTPADVDRPARHHKAADADAAKPAAGDDAKPAKTADAHKDTAAVDTGKAPAPDESAPGKPDPFAVDPALGHALRIDGDEAEDLVAFTFDDGPNPETTPAVLTALARYDIPATFFIVAQRLVGKHGERSRALLAREDREGYLIGSHSFSHLNLKHASKSMADKEVVQAQKIIAETLGRPLGLFRPPFGALGGAAATAVKNSGLTDVLWSVDTLDWRTPNAAKLRKKVMRMILAQRGGVVLMHDIKKVTAKVIGDIFDDLEIENCARLAKGGTPIIPVSLHYFLRDGVKGKGKPRPIPPEVAARTASYRATLAARCAARPAPAPAATTTPATTAPKSP
ncbi:MAG: polysaccharide deacetylase family protein [Deltaproteobacteria bacterium]|nr:polysaccharide deacetylase family protein [Deltaproteobacteria bacterium]